MADIEITGETIRDVAAHRVYLKERWADGWVEQPHLYCDFVEFAAGPSKSTGGLGWKYGEGLRQGERVFGHVDPLDKLRHWVKVEIDQPDDDDGDPTDPILWYGRVDEEGRNLRGPFADGLDARQPAGGQRIVAYGMAQVLDRQPLAECWYRLAADDERRLGRFLEVNPQNQVADSGNRSDALGPRGTYLFAGNLTNAEKWSTRTFLEYLCKYHAPTDHLGNEQLQVKIDPDAAQYLFDWDAPELRIHGRTFKQVLDELIDRRRLLGYTLEVEVGGGHLGEDALVIRPFNYLDQVLDLPDWEVIPPNAHNYTLDFDASLDVGQASLKRSASQTYDQVTAYGDRLICCGTISAVDTTMVGHWTGADEIEYETAASALGAYPAADFPDMRQQMNADYRSQEHLRRVYSYFGLPDDWDGQVKNGVGGAAVDLFPYDELGLDSARFHGFYLPDLRCERQLPLTDTAQTPTDQKYEYLRPIVLIKLLDEIAPADSYGHVERLAVCAEIEGCGEGAGRDFCLSVRNEEDGPGIVLKVSGSQPQHAIASADFTPLPDDPSESTAQYNWRDNLLATVAIKADYVIRASRPDPLVEPRDVVRTLALHAGRRAQLHYVAPRTVIGLGDDNQLVHHAGGFVRDDRTWLEQLAGVAWQWYGRQRQALTLSYRSATKYFEIGWLIATIGEGATLQTVNTVVTSIRVELAQNSNELHRTTIETQWAELDVLRLL